MTLVTHDLLGLAYGLIVGVSLGLTGGGGSIFAVPLLIYGLGIPVGTSIGLSLASVGITAGLLQYSESAGKTESCVIGSGKHPEWRGNTKTISIMKPLSTHPYGQVLQKVIIQMRVDAIPFRIFR